MPWLIAALVIIIGLYFIARWWVQADPRLLVKALRWTGIVVGVALLAFIVIAARWNLLPLVVFTVLPWFLRARTRRKNAQGPRPGQTSEISTRFIRMVLDHDSGEMTGDIIDGQFSGRNLRDLNLGELIELWRECAAGDEQSRLVLENYLDREKPEWRAAAGVGPRDETAEARSDSPWANTGMSADEACEILGVSPGASTEDIENAYRTAMKNAHPDQGGSDWMAAKVNQAKDVLLGN
jgi:hypothetical protein